MKKVNNRSDRVFAFAVHFFFGAILGAVFGLGYWAYYADTDSAKAGIICIVGGALLAGIIAGIAKDDFWTDYWKGIAP